MFGDTEIDDGMSSGIETMRSNTSLLYGLCCKAFTRYVVLPGPSKISSAFVNSLFTIQGVALVGVDYKVL